MFSCAITTQDLKDTESVAPPKAQVFRSLESDLSRLSAEELTEMIHGPYWTGWALVQATLDTKESRRILLLSDFPNGIELAEILKPSTSERWFSARIPGNKHSFFFKELTLMELMESMPPELIGTLNLNFSRDSECQVISEPTLPLMDTGGNYVFHQKEGELWYIYKLSITKLLFVGKDAACKTLASELKKTAFSRVR